MTSSLSFAHAFQTPEHQPFVLDGTNGHAIVLIHGFPGTPGEMRLLAASLHQHGFSLICPLLPGFGSQIDTLTQKTNADWLHHILSTCRQHRSLYARMTIVGHSLGGALAAQVAAQMPVDKLVLLAPFWRLDHILWTALPIIRHFIPVFRPFRLMKPDFNSEEFRAGIRNFLPDANLDDENVQQQIVSFRLPLAVLNEIRTAGHKGHAARRRINCPVLVIQGNADPLVTPSQTQTYTADWPVAQYCEVSAAHDLVQDERALSQVLPLIFAFLNDGAQA